MKGVTLPFGMQYTDTRHKAVQVTRDMTAASGSVSYAGAGFAPKGAVVIGSVSATLGVGWSLFDSSGTGGAVYVNGVANSYVPQGAYFVLEVTSGNYQSFTISSWDSDGVTVSWTKGGTPTGTGTITFMFLR